MIINLGDTISFDYNVPTAKDKKPVIFFLAEVGHLVHGLNQHYQSPQEKYYYWITLKTILHQKIRLGTMTAEKFYRYYIKNRLITDSYRTYKKDEMSNISILGDDIYAGTQKIDIRDRRTTFGKFKTGDRVKFIEMMNNKLRWIQGTVLGKVVPGANYKIRTDTGQIVQRHPADIKPITWLSNIEVKGEELEPEI